MQKKGSFVPERYQPLRRTANRTVPTTIDFSCEKSAKGVEKILSGGIIY